MRTFFLALIGVCSLVLLARGAQAFDIEEETWFRSDTEVAQLHIISTTDTQVFAPLINAFQAEMPEVSIRYVMASSQQVFQALYHEGLHFDVAISSAMDLQMKLANDGYALTHQSTATAGLPGWARWRDQLFAFTQEPVVLAVARDALAPLPTPRTRADLIQLIRDYPDRFTDKIGTYDPRASGAGYLFASQDARQSDTFWRLSEAMGGLRPRLYVSTGSMIDDLQSGEIILAYNVLGSYLSERLESWPGGEMVELRDYTQVLLRTAFVPAAAQSPDLGRAFVDSLLSEAGQSLIEQATGLPKINEAALAAAPHKKPIRLDPGLMVYVDPIKKRNFLDEWAEAVVRD